MPRPLPLRLLAAILFAPHLAAEPVKIFGAAEAVRFSGSERDSLARIRWTGSADRAESVPGGAAGSLRLTRARITTFEKTGGALITLTAPQALYDGEARTASDKGPVVIENARLKLSGRDWKWVSGAADTVTLDEAVSVTLRSEKSASAPVTISADHLRARLDDAGARLDFTGNVFVMQGETSLSCDTLGAFVRGSAKTPDAKLAADAVESIEGSGSVRLSDRGSQITGKTCRVVPAKKLYSISGDAAFFDLGNRVRVTGDSMSFDAISRVVNIVPPADSPDGRVGAEIPALDSSRPDARAAVSARTIRILITPETNTLLLTGAVKLDDPEYSGSCEKLTAELDHDDSAKILKSDPDSRRLRRVLVEESVTLVRGRRTLTADRAEISPREKRIVLTGSPKAVDADENTSLEAGVITLDTADRESGALLAEPAAGAPVRATFPPVLRAASATPTTITADLLRVTRRGKSGVFEFQGHVRLAGDDLEGSCDRLGAEVGSPPAPGAKAAERIRLIVAVGSVKLRQGGYAAETGRAEIRPQASLRELAADGGVGDDPFHVLLSPDESSPGLRPVVTLPPTPAPKFNPAATPEATGETAPTIITADFQEIIKGDKKLKAFARGSVALSAANLTATAGNIELLALKKADAKNAFVPETLIARGGVDIRFPGAERERKAHAETLVIKPGEKTLSLIGDPSVDDWFTPPGTARKTVFWETIPEADGRALTKIRLRDEPREGVTGQVARPTVILPIKGVPNLGREINKLDNPK